MKLKSRYGLTLVAKKQETKEFNLEEVCALWEMKGEKPYLKGQDNEKKVVLGFYRNNKKNPKEPDIVVCDTTENGKAKDEIIALWSTISKESKKEYLYGKTKDGEGVVAFYSQEVEGKNRPKIRVYFRDENEKID